MDNTVNSSTRDVNGIMEDGEFTYEKSDCIGFEVDGLQYELSNGKNFSELYKNEELINLASTIKSLLSSNDIDGIRTYLIQHIGGFNLIHLRSLRSKGTCSYDTLLYISSSTDWGKMLEDGFNTNLGVYYKLDTISKTYKIVPSIDNLKSRFITSNGTMIPLKPEISIEGYNSGVFPKKF